MKNKKKIFSLLRVIMVFGVIIATLTGCNGKSNSGTNLSYIASDGSEYSYTGELKNSKPHGQGSANYADGSNYTGRWENGKRDGQGILTYASGDHYEGEFKDDLYNGQGVYTYANGDRYEGEFKDGIFNEQ